MATHQLVGDSQKLNKAPTSTPSSDPKMGTVQKVGDSLPLNRTAHTSPSANPKGGTIQKVGEQAPINRTPQKGYGSAFAYEPMSERAVAQSNTVGVGKGRKK